MLCGVDRLSDLFIKKDSGFRRRKSDLEAKKEPSTENVSAMTAFRVCRWIQRDGKTVRFSQGIGPFQGRVHVHYLPSLAIAHAFAVALLKTDMDGFPAPLDPEEWAAWQEEYDRI